ncbi:hypothetical protein [Paenibacillus sp. DMB20]|uniref:hypothetical protein n=1 Tax=Paenibacillus sp. DMB20 TaxID=1642570 RepID=UPI00128D2857|nr:hypothetical protein [Paenibacillus sp. DMB20]
MTTKLRLLKLIPEVQDLIAEGVISSGHAVQILKIEALIDRLCGKRCFKGDEKTAFDFFQKAILNSIKSAKGKVTVSDVAGMVDALRERFLAAIIAVFTGHWAVHIEKYESFSVTAHGYCLQYDLRIESLEPGDIDFLRDRMLKGAENDPEAPARWEIYQRTDRLAEAMFSDGKRPAWPEDEIARRSQKIYNETTGEFDDGLMDRVFRQQFVFHDDDVSCDTL